MKLKTESRSCYEVSFSFPHLDLCWLHRRFDFHSSLLRKFLGSTSRKQSKICFFNRKNRKNNQNLRVSAGIFLVFHALFMFFFFSFFYVLHVSVIWDKLPEIELGIPDTTHTAHRIYREIPEDLNFFLKQLLTVITHIESLCVY